MATATYARICPFCESSCGLKVEVDTDAGKLLRVSGDPEHPGSRGFVCAKSQGLVGLRSDPDRLRKPLVRVGNDFREVEWPEALDRAAAGLRGVIERHGGRGFGVYTGNPQSHVAGMQMCMGALFELAPAVYTNAGSIDCYPRFLADTYLYGNLGHVPVPDIERTSFFLIFGGNPVVSNGSMMGAPNMPARLRRLRERGGKLVVVDPRRSETARIADEHFAVRPGTDALLALAMIDTLFEEQLVRLGRLRDSLAGLDELRAAAARYNAQRVAPLVQIPAERIRQLARDFAGAKSAVAYGRVGANCQTFGSLAIWAIDCLNVLTGNLDEAGGAIFPSGILPQFLNMPYEGAQPPHGRWRSRVSNTPELGGTLPTQVLWEEIETPGPGQIRGLVVIAGNPVLSNANSRRVSDALRNLEFMVSIDIYQNETSRHADVILPPMEHLKRSEFTMIYANWMVEDIVCYSPPVYAREPGDYDDWDIVIELASRLTGESPDALARRQAESYLTHYKSSLPRLPSSLSVDAALAMATGDTMPEKIYDVLLRGGASGDGFGRFEAGLSLERLKLTPSGVSFGPRNSGRFPAAIDTPDGRIPLAAPIFLDDLHRLETAIENGAFQDGSFTLINRRHIRSNNSWMHNLHSLTKGPRRCTALVNPDDATQLRIQNGDWIRIRSRVGEITIAAEISDEVAAGVVCVPHGWSDADPQTRLSLAHSYGGANVNVLSDDSACDAPSGGASFNATPVQIEVLAQRPQ
jgi:anaerobic selenocysteine-containing dehydrogenase